MDYVFISYSSEDKAVADATCATLESAGIRCWIAPRDITPGRMWGEAIIDGINASRLMILIFSRHSNKSPQVYREIERAGNRGMLLLQLRVEDIRPSRALELFISSSQWLDAFPPPVEGHLDRLPATIQRLLRESHPTEEREVVRIDSVRSRRRGTAFWKSSPRKWGGKSWRIASIGLVATLSGLSIVTAKLFLSDNPVKSSGAPDSVMTSDSMAANPPSDTSRPQVHLPAPSSQPLPESTTAKTAVERRRSPPQSTPDVPSKANVQPVIPNVQPVTAHVQPLNDAALIALATPCIEALRKGDQTWLSNHYGLATTVVDQNNIKNLSELLRKKGYEAALLSEPVVADGVINFTVQFQYVGGFGPKLRLTAAFEVRTAVQEGKPELASCRVKETLRLR